MQDFFIQVQVNSSNNKIYGYEVLLRQKVDGNWIRPKQTDKLPLNKQVKMVAETAKFIKKRTSNIESISFNLTKEEAENSKNIKNILALQKRIQPLQLLVELTEDVELHKLKTLSTKLHHSDIELAIDDVGTGSNTYQNIKPALPYVDKLKFTMNVSKPDISNAERLSFWKEQAEDHDLDMIVRGVGCQKDQKLAQEMDIDVLQGQFFGEPVLI